MIVAVLDACVLYPPALRDLFMWLAAAMVFQPRWTEEIHDEWIRNVLADNPDLSLAQLVRTRRLMNLINDECLVIGYERHIRALTLPDPNDRHVLAAAIEANASTIVTFNLSDFPESTLRSHQIRATHPDTYLAALYDDAPDLFLSGVRDHRASLKRPPKTPTDYVETLKAHGLLETAGRLARRLDET